MQSNAARAGLAVALVALAVVLFVVLRDDGSDGEAPRSAQTQGTTTSGGGGKPESGGRPETPPVPAIVVRDGAPVGGPTELDVTSGDVVRFTVSADEAGDVHVHGYEIERPVQPGKKVSIVFPAGIEGGYEIEFHSHTTGDIPIAELAVNPG
jgi:hypothetical protein